MIVYVKDIMSRTLRINISLPKTVVDELQKMILPRKRSEFIAQATKEKLDILKQQKVLEKAAGAWKDENHPTLNTPEDMALYLRETRGSYEARLKRYANPDD